MATKAEESQIWQRIEKAVKYREIPVGNLSRETVITDAIQASLDAINSIEWTGRYTQPGHSVRQIKPLLHGALQIGSDKRPHLVTIDTDSVHPNLPTEYDTESIEDIRGYWLEGWILAIAGRLDSSTGVMNYSELLNAPLVWNAYLSASAYLATKEAFVPISDLQKIDAAIENAETAASNAEDTDNTLSERLRKFESEASAQEQKLEAVVSRAEAFADYKKLYDYFGNKAWWHTLNFWLFLLTFFAGASSLGALVWWYRAEIIPLLPTISSSGFEIGKTIIIAAPALVAIWFLRVFLRLSMLNLRLKEDAQNRQVLLQTLAALEDDDGDKIGEKERVVAYSAIFRSSLPDQSDLDISNPTIADIAGMFKKG